MSYVKPLCAGALIFFAGYCTGSCSSPVQAKTLEQTVVEKVSQQDRKERLFSFLQTHKARKGEEPFSLETFWKGLPAATKTSILKQVASHQLEQTYENVKGQSTLMYEELRHYLQKHLGRQE